MKHLPILFLLLFALACNNSSTSSNAEEEENEELTYADLWDLVIQDTGERIEWHGESLNLSMKDPLTISTNGSCGENNCGESVFLSNNSDQTIEVTVQAPFQIEDVSSHLAAKYIIKPGATIAMGCSHLCYKGESISFARRIVGAKPISG